MVQAPAICAKLTGRSWRRQTATISVSAYLSGNYRAVLSWQTLFPNRLEVSMRWRPVGRWTAAQVTQQIADAVPLLRGSSGGGIEAVAAALARELTSPRGFRFAGVAWGRASPPTRATRSGYRTRDTRRRDGRREGCSAIPYPAPAGLPAWRARYCGRRLAATSFVVHDALYT